MTDKLQFVGITSRGYSIYREDNEVGGSRYWSDEIGGGVMIWDTCLADQESLKLAMAIENEILAQIGKDF